VKVMVQLKKIVLELLIFLPFPQNLGNIYVLFLQIYPFKNIVIYLK